VQPPQMPNLDYLPLPERHHDDRQVVDGGFAGAVAEALGVAEAGLPTPSALLALGPEGGSLSRTTTSRTAAGEALAVAEADGGLPTPSSRSSCFAWGAVTALASRAAPSWVWVATETTGGRSSVERSSS
jgi:hypothetical protein